MAAGPPSHPDRPRLVVLDDAVEARSRGPVRPTIVHVLATRPDAVTLAPVVAALEPRGTFDQLVLHTGQHSGAAMVDDMLADLGLPEPARNLGTGSGHHEAQTARALVACAEALTEIRPAAVVVTGASNSSLGAALAAAKLGLPVARVEAGLREHDWSVPEEVNRVLLDTLADLLFAPTAEAAANLGGEGVGAGRVHVVGSTAVDSLRRAERVARSRSVWRRYGVERGAYVLVTLHRPANVDDDERLARIVEGLAGLAVRVPVVFPLHPRTRQRLTPMGDAHRLLAAGVLCGPPLSYVDFLSLQAGAGAIVTDSGTVQEEASALGVSCFTLRSSTERVVTLTHGTNVLLGDDPRDIADLQLAPTAPAPCTIPLWDGRAGERIAAVLIANYAIVRASGSS
ncbi:MAG: non-hydrolyzing UDP-N-acetylglucosamine 2-epimerase [Solirubrobacteraceae bacterium]